MTPGDGSRRAARGAAAVGPGRPRPRPAARRRPGGRDLPGVTLVTLDAPRRAARRSRARGRRRRRSRDRRRRGRGLPRAQRAARVAPTVVALRQLAADVVAAELARLDARLPDLDPAVAAEVAQTVRRTVDKLLHAPTVRMKELAADEGGHAYAEALHGLFDLDPAAVDLVARGRPHRRGGRGA